LKKVKKIGEIEINLLKKFEVKMIEKKLKKMDMHVHSIYSGRPSEWILKTIGTRESYVSPLCIYEFAKRKGMDYVTITDHNKIDGIVKLKEKKADDTIIGVELTTYFPEDEAKVHILLYNFEPAVFERLNHLRENIYELRDYIFENNIFYVVAHPFYAVNNKFNIDHLEKLMLLFNNFEAINGGRNIEINRFTQKFLKSLNEEKIYHFYKKHGIKPFGEKPWLKILTAGSDDHTGLFIGSAYNYSLANSIDEFLLAIKNGNSEIEGESLKFETHAFQIIKIASDFYKYKSLKEEELDNLGNLKVKSQNIKEISENNDKNISLWNLIFKKDKSKTNIIKELINSFNKVIFEREKLSIKEKIIFNRALSNAKKKGDEIKKLLLEFILKVDQFTTFNAEKVSNELFNTISAIINSYLKTFVKSLTENIENNDLVYLIGKFSSFVVPIILSLPYITSVNHLWKDRRLIEEVEERYFINKKEFKKLAWFTDTLLDLNGVSVTLQNIGNYSAKKNKDLYFITSLKPQDFNKVKFKFNILNFEPTYTFVNDIYKHFEVKIPSILEIIQRLYQLNPDEIIISTPGPVGLTGLLISKLLCIPSKMIFHTDFSKEAYEIVKDQTLVGIIDYLLKTIYNLSDQILANTNEYLNALIEKGFDKDKLKIFKRGINLSKFRDLKKENIDIVAKFWQKHNLEDANFILLYTGRISKDKNLDFIINLFGEINKKFSEARFLILGDGPYLEELKQKYSSIDGLHFVGIIDNDEIVNYYSMADLFVFPSTTDTFGMSVLEAQACGLPAIVSDIGGPKEIVINNKTGFILNIEKNLWKNKITELIIDKRLGKKILKAISNNAAKHIQDNFDIEDVIDSYFIKDDFKEKYLNFSKQNRNINNKKIYHKKIEKDITHKVIRDKKNQNNEDSNTVDKKIYIY